jgi:uncharacterized membrane protein SirB2
MPEQSATHGRTLRLGGTARKSETQRLAPLVLTFKLDLTATEWQDSPLRQQAARPRQEPMAYYPALRNVHVACAAISIGLFATRGAMQLRGIDWRRWRWLRIVPHVNDTLLLAAAVALAAMSAQYPLVQPWLTAKVLALFVYVMVGSIALRRNVSMRVRRIAFPASLAAVGYIVGVAMTRSVTLGFA